MGEILKKVQERKLRLYMYVMGGILCSKDDDSDKKCRGMGRK